MMKPGNSLITRYNITFSVIFMISLAVILALNFVLTLKSNEQESRIKASLYNEIIISKISERLRINEKVVNNFIKTELTGLVSISDLRQKLTGFVRENEDIFCSFISVGFDTEITDSTSILEFTCKDRNIEDQVVNPGFQTMLRSWQERIKNQNSPFWSEPYQNTATNESVCAYINGVTVNFPGQVPLKGVLITEINTGWLRRMVEAVSNTFDGSVFILTGGGIPLLVEGKNFGAGVDVYEIVRITNNPDLLALAKEMMAGRSGLMKMNAVFDKEPSEVCYSPVLPAGWSVALITPRYLVVQNLFVSTILLSVVALVFLLIMLIIMKMKLRRMTKPLLKFSEVAYSIGQGKFDNELPYVYSRDEIELLKDSFENMQSELHARDRSIPVKSIDNHHVSDKEGFARHAHLSMLRQDWATFSSDNHIDLAVFFKPGIISGSGFYDFFHVGKNSVCLFVGDTNSRGTQSILFIHLALSLFRISNCTAENLRQIVTDLNKSLYKSTDYEISAVGFIGVLNIESGELIFCNAGNADPYLIRDHELFEVSGLHGNALGSDIEQVYKTGKFVLQQDDLLLIFTSGITEAKNNLGESFGKGRIEEMLMGMVDQPAAKIHDVATEYIDRFTEGFPVERDFVLLALNINESFKKSAE